MTRLDRAIHPVLPATRAGRYGIDTVGMDRPIKWGDDG
jgi:hypothetical protein